MKKHIFLGAAMLLLVAACSHDENNNGGTEPLQKVQFSFTNEDFGEDEALTRATSATEKPQTIDLGDCEAEISVENEPAVKTRGTLTNANGHYTIRAYQGGTLKGEVKGTFSGGAFTPDAGAASNFNLDPGTYDFVAFNDDVIPSGTGLTVARDKAETARMGFATQVITATPQKQQVMFTMKHVGARLRMQFLCKKDMPNAITSVLEAADANGIPVSVAYNPTTKAYTATNGTMASESSNSPASTETKYSASNYGQNYSYTSTCTDYHYFLPATEGSNLKLTLSAGTIFWKPLTGTIPQLNATLSMQSNKSYLVKIKMKPQFTYLMSDGTIGYFKDTTFGGAPAATAKTPIAVVVNANLHMAIALKNAINNGWVSWRNGASYYAQANTHAIMTGDWNDAFNSQATSGLDETWDASYSTGSFGVKATNPKFPPFNVAANYDPGVAYTGSPALQWYLPSYNDFRYLYPLGCGDETTIHSPNVSYKWYGNLANSAFTQVGGTTVLYNYFHTSTEYKYSNEYLNGILHPSSSDLIFSHGGSTTAGGVRPFVKY